MAGEVPTTLVLKSSTKITLNERFSNLAKVVPQPSFVDQQRQVRSARAAADRQELSRNQRLALQMAHRRMTADDEALDDEPEDARIPQVQPRRSMSERLGLRRAAPRGARRGVKSRLAYAPTASLQSQGLSAGGDFTNGAGRETYAAHRGATRGSGRAAWRGRRRAGRVFVSRRGQGRGRIGPSEAQALDWAIGSYDSVTAAQGGLGRAAVVAGLAEYYRSAARTRPVARGRRARGRASIRGHAQPRGGVGAARYGAPGGSPRGYRGFSGRPASARGQGRSRGRGGRGRGAPTAAHKEELDRQLDEYMAQTQHSTGL